MSIILIIYYNNFINSILLTYPLLPLLPPLPPLLPLPPLQPSQPSSPPPSSFTRSTP